MDFYIQFRYSRPINSNSLLGEIVGVYDVNEIMESPAASGHLAWIKITGFPETITKQILWNMLGAQIAPDDETPNYGRKALFEFGNLPSPYDTEFQQGREATIPFNIAVPIIYDQVLSRTMQTGDF